MAQFSRVELESKSYFWVLSGDLEVGTGTGTSYRLSLHQYFVPSFHRYRCSSTESLTFSLGKFCYHCRLHFWQNWFTMPRFGSANILC